MKIHPTVWANASAVTTGFVWIICTLGIALFPDLSLTMSKWFMHGLDMTTMGIWKVSLDGFFFGGVTLITFAWLTGLVFGLSLQYFGRK